jgi:hypothetical protein
MHELLGDTLNVFLPTLGDWLPDGNPVVKNKVSYTMCYLTLALDTSENHIVGGRPGTEAAEQFRRQGDHTAFQQIIDPSLLTLSESHRLRFRKAMRVLDISPHYYLSELEPHVKHPIKDKALAEVCSCCDLEESCLAMREMCIWERIDCIEEILEGKGKGELHTKICGPLLNVYLTLSRAFERVLAKAHDCCCFRCGDTLYTRMR